MSAHCDHHHHDDEKSAGNPRYRKILWIALIINLAMFGVEIGAGFRSGSVSLLADAIDFFGDSANYAVTLVVLGMSPLWRGRAALVKGASMLLFGGFVLAKTGWALAYGFAPEAVTMGVVGMMALVANVAVALMLYAWREGDANMRSVWLCSRNDAIGNIAVMLAALGVLGTGSALPDLGVALAMALLALSSGWSVVRHALSELGQPRHAPVK
jgi:Co/Zn/Cd efflux system component